jgi:hypothetical protein
MNFKALLLNLLEDLEAIGKENEEIYDTVCRHKMSNPIHYLFLIPDFNYKISDDFGLYSSSANEAVKQAIENYVIRASRIASINNMTFHERLAVFQDEDVVTGSKLHNGFDDFFGWANPEEFDDSGKWMGYDNENYDWESKSRRDDEYILFVDGQLDLFDTEPYRDR